MNVRTVNTRKPVEEGAEWTEISITEVMEHLTHSEMLIIK
jgi:hypothetical protein